MIIFPAVDIIGGEAVRLYKGDYAQKTVYGKPIEIAEKFKSVGATHIHIVDLDGAKSGDTPNFDVIARIKRETGLFCETGGGIRDLKTVDKYVSAGIDRVILGTAAITEKGFVKKAIELFGEKIAVGADIKDGFIAVKGWTEKSEKDAFSFFAEMRDLGVKTVICTDIGKDGALKGTNRELYGDISEKFDFDLIASGGVSGTEDIIALKNIGIYGAIVGKAIYTGAVDLKRALEITK